MINDYESIDQRIQKKMDERFIKKNASKHKTLKKGKNKKLKIIALIMASVIAVTSGIFGISNLLKNKTKESSNNNNNNNNKSISTMEIDDIGSELDFVEQPKTEYGETTGNVDVNKIVEKNGKIYVDQKSADKSDKVGKSTIDTKDGTLDVKPDGTVTEKAPGYEIQDKDGNVIDEGDLNNGKVPGYENDLPEGYVYADATYYNEEGNVLIEKGEVVTKDWLDYLKKNFSTTKPTIQENTSSQVSNNSSSQTVSKTEEGILNPDGTYTIYGITFETKADYQQWVIQGGEGYGIDSDGIMKAMPDLEVEKQKIK